VPAAEPASRRLGAERGQASVELVAAVPALLVAAAVALQVLAAGYSLTLADGAAEAAAMAVAAGRAPGPAARAALPGWAADRIAVTRDGGSVSVTLRPPSPIGALAEALAVTSAAWVRPPGAG